MQAGKQKESADSLVQSRSAAVFAAKARMAATGDMESYLRVRAPFDGTITDRFVHPGMMVDPNGHTPLLRLQQTTHLRLVVPVPERYVGSIAKGKSVSFRVPAHPGKSYTGKIARIARDCTKAHKYSNDGHLWRSSRCTELRRIAVESLC